MNAKLIKTAVLLGFTVLSLSACKKEVVDNTPHDPYTVLQINSVTQKGDSVTVIGKMGLKISNAGAFDKIDISIVDIDGSKKLVHTYPKINLNDKGVPFNFKNIGTVLNATDIVYSYSYTFPTTELGKGVGTTKGTTWVIEAWNKTITGENLFETLKYGIVLKQ